jgi:hypothetical protein
LSRQWLSDCENANQRNDQARIEVFHFEVTYVASLADFMRADSVLQTSVMSA